MWSLLLLIWFALCVVAFGVDNVVRCVLRVVSWSVVVVVVGCCCWSLLLLCVVLCLSMFVVCRMFKSGCVLFVVLGVSMFVVVIVVCRCCDWCVFVAFLVY